MRCMQQTRSPRTIASMVLYVNHDAARLTEERRNKKNARPKPGVSGKLLVR